MARHRLFLRLIPLTLVLLSGAWVAGLTPFAAARAQVPSHAPDLSSGPRLAAGDAHTCAIDHEGAVACWGDNTWDQAPPRQFAAEGRFVQVAAGGHHTCALRDDGAVECWGAAAAGGHLTRLGGYVQISAGFAHSCAVSPDGLVACWGENGFGQAPAVTRAAQNRFVQVSAGTYHTCGLRDDGLVECWGAGGADAGMFPHHGQAPTARAGTTGAITAISAGAYHTCALTAAGQVECWGLNGSGQAAPMRSAAVGAFTAVSAGGGHSCALSTGGDIECWGWNDDGQAPVRAQPTTGAYLQLAAGLRHTCGLTTEGRVDCWGNNESGQTLQPQVLSDGPMALSAAGLEDMTMSAMAAMTSEGGLGSAGGRITTGRSHSCALRTDGTITCWGPAAQTAAPTGTFIQVSAGNFHTCALRGDRTAVCWGENADGQTNAPGGTFAEISAGGWYTCGLRPSGDVTCWGSNLYGQLQSPVGPFVQISAGQFHMCALRNDRQLNCWGNNGSNRASPPSGRYREVTAGGYHSCAVRYDGAATCWGDNTFSKTSIPSGTGTVAHISAGQDHTCAIRTNGTMVCWGNNQQGQTTVPTGTPTPTYTQVAAGGFHTCAARAGGSLVCWGQTSSGQSTVPGGGAMFGLRQVTGGESHSCGLKSDGSLTCWGSNHSGVATPPGGLFNQVSASRGHTCAIRDTGTVACWGTNLNNASTPPASVFRQISLGGESACGVRADGSLQCWGNSLGSTPSATRFIEVSLGFSHACTIRDTGLAVCWGVTGNDFGEATAPSGVYFKQLSLGNNHSCGVRGNGGITCWGRNNNGQSTPPGGLFTQVTAGVSHACGITDSGTVACWGLADERIQAPAGTFLQIEAGYHHTCGIRTDGTLSCWGDNSFGRAPRLSINPTGLIDATRQMAYSQTLTATGGTGPYTFSFGSGTLPPGLSVGSNGVLSGTPTTAGTFTFTIRVSDSSAMPLSALQSFTLRVLTIVNGVCTVGPSGAHYTTINGAIENLHCQTITVPAGTYREMLSIGRSLTINGAGTSSTFLDGEIVPGNVESYRRVVNITAGTVTLTGLTVRNGRARPTLDWSGGLDGGGIRALSGTNVTVRDVAVSGSTASSEGGGIASYGTLTLDNVSLTNNTATTGGGLYASGPVTLDSVTIRANQALGDSGNGRGGGMYILGDTIADRLAVIDNTASSTGGGIYRDAGQFNQGSLTLRRSLIANNNAALGGGLHTSGDVHLINVTVTSNTGEGISGSGGMFSGPAINLSSVTLSHNVGGGYSAGGITRLVARNTIFASNTGRNCVGGIVNLGNNIRWPASDTSCYDAEPNFPQPVPFVDPQLGALAANGGPAQTRALGAGSAAIDAGTCVDVNNNAIATDQRGVARPQPTGWHCDIGAFEVERVRDAQVITFAALADKTYGDAPFTISASASSGLLVNFSVSGSCTVSASSLVGSTSSATVTLTTAGLCTITASQAGNSQYAPAEVERLLTVAPRFDDLSAPTIPYGTASTPLSGRLVSGTTVPAGNVSITLAGTTQLAPIGGTGAFSASFATGARPAGTYAVDYSYAGSPTIPAATATRTLTITQAVPTFTELSVPTVDAGTSSVIVSGRVTTSTVTPPGFVSVTLVGATQFPTIAADGTFSCSFPTASIGAGTYPVTFTYQGSANFQGASATTDFVVRGVTQFSTLSAPTIGYGTSPTVLTGRIVAGTVVPTGNVSVVLSGVTQTAGIAADGTFSSSFNTSTLPAGSHVASYAYAGGSIFTPATATSSVTVVRAAPVFSDLSTPTIFAGSVSTTISGRLAAGTAVPPGNVSITLAGVTQQAAIQADGTFSSAFATAMLAPGPYPIAFAYAATSNFEATAGSSGLVVVKYTPIFTDLSAPAIDHGTPATTLSGKIAAGAVIPTGTVAIALGTVTQQAPIASDGTFSSVFDTAGLADGQHQIEYRFPGNATFDPALQQRTLSVYFPVCDVGPSGAPFSRIHAAVDNAFCRTIRVAEGTYHESIRIGRDVTITGAGAGRTFVDGSDNSVVFTITGGTVALSGLTIQHGRGLDGGGVRNEHGANLTIAGVHIRSNRAERSGSGIYNEGLLTLRDSALTGNNLGTGAIYNFRSGIHGFAQTATLTNVTISNNNSGGVVRSGAGLIAISFATISNNTFTGVASGSNSVTVRNSIVANNGTNCTAGTGFIDGGNNIRWPESDPSCLGAYGDPMLAPLGDYGGPTPTRGLQAGSAALDAVPPDACTDLSGSGVATDQRGVPRPDGTFCDAGAFEGLVVIKTTQTIDFTALAGRTYGDAPFTISASASSGLLVSFAASGTCTVSPSSVTGGVSSATVSLAGAGSCTITAAQTGDDNYHPALSVERSFTIASATATLALSDLVHAYDSTPKAATAATTPAGVIGVTVTYGGSSTPPVNAGEYLVVASLNHPDYAATPATGTLVINPAAVTITPDGGKSKAYGQTFSAFSGSVAGLHGEDAITPVYASAGAAAIAGVGAYDITVASYSFTSGLASNYSITTNVAAAGLTVGPASLTIVPDAGHSKTYGQIFSAFTGTVSGLVNDDQVVPVYTSPGAAASAAAGSYDITVASYGFTSGVASNYTVATHTAAGGLTVGRAALTITPDGGKTKTYGQPFSAFTGTLTGLVDGDHVVPVYASAGAAAAAGAGTYDITVGSYAFTTGSAANYTVSTGAAADGLTVGQAALTITPDAGKTKTYGQPFSAFTGTLTGLVDGDQVAPVYASAGAAAAAGAGTYDITVESYAFTTGSAANYTVSTGAAAGGLIVNPAALTIAADPQVKQYLAPLPAFTVQHSGFVNGESPAVLGGTTTCGSPATAVSVVGAYPVTCDGQSSANYTISYVPSTLTIVPLPIAAAVTFSPASPQYSDRVTITASIANAGGLPPASGMTFSIDGTSIGTAPFVLNGGSYTASVESSALMLPPGTVTVAPAFAGANPNYVVSHVPAPLLLTIAREDARFAYTGLEFVTTPSARDTVASVVLSATVRDVTLTPGDDAYDQNAGDIRHARISFLDRETNKVLCSNLVPVLVDTDPGTGTVACTVVLSTGNNGSQQYRIGMEATGHYLRNTSEDDAVVTVSQPINSMITGGGHLINQASTGQYAGGAGLKTRAGFSVKYNKSLTSLQGSVRILVIDNSRRVYEIKSNSLSSLATNLNTGTASFLSKATLTDITNPANPIPLGGNLTLQMTLTDAGAGPLDTVGITLSHSSGALLFSSRWNGAQTVEQNLNGGNLVVR